MKETSEDIGALHEELVQILRTPSLIGHRGGNDLSNPKELEIHRDRVEKHNERLLRARNIALLLYAAENHINPDDYLNVGPCRDMLKITRDEIDVVEDYHPDDIAVQLYIGDYSGGPIREVRGYLNVYRKKGSEAVSRDVIWNPDRKWCQLHEFEYTWRDCMHPLRKLTELKDRRKRKIIDTSDVDEAIDELEELFGIES